MLALGPFRAKLWIPIVALGIHFWRSLDQRYGIFIGVTGYYDAGVLFRSDTRLDALLWGCWVALISPYLLNLVARYPKTCSALPLLVLFAIIAALYLSLPLMTLFLAVGFAALVGFTAINSEGIIVQILQHSLLQWIGRISYSIYIWQTLFLQIPVISLSTDTHNWLFWLMDLSAIFIVACLSYYYIEQPSIIYSHQFSLELLRRSEKVNRRKQ